MNLVSSPGEDAVKGDESVTTSWGRFVPDPNLALKEEMLLRAFCPSFIMAEENAKQAEDIEESSLIVFSRTGFCWMR